MLNCPAHTYDYYKQFESAMADSYSNTALSNRDYAAESRLFSMSGSSKGDTYKKWKDMTSPPNRVVLMLDALRANYGQNSYSIYIDRSPYWFYKYPRHGNHSNGLYGDFSVAPIMKLSTYGASPGNFTIYFAY